MDSEQLLVMLEQKDFKNKLIKELNDDIDIPFINEETEKKVLEKLYKVLLKVLKEQIDK